MRYGLQLFGLNPIFLQDKEGFLQKASAAGYRYLEPDLKPAGLNTWLDHFWTEDDFAVNQPLLEKYGFKMESIHVFSQDILADLPQLIPFAQKYGIRQLVLPCPKEINPAVAVDLTKAGDRLQAYGMELLLHNAKDDLGFGWLLMATGESVGAQVDVGWLKYHGIDPEAFLWKHQKKVKSLHYKDFDEAGKEVQVGTGTVDMETCFQFARANEIIQLMDQDSSEGDFLEDVAAVGARLRGMRDCRSNSVSELCILDTVTGEVTLLHTFDHIMEAPNWLQTDPDKLFFNDEGRIYRYSIQEDSLTLVDTGSAVRCNNDHVLSPDNRFIAVSHNEESWMSRIFILPIEGGEPRLVTPNRPSFLHGWSPDGKELCYCAFRDHGKGTEVDVYAISAEGGEEWQLTSNAGFNDGPEYSPDGKHIWFNSTRTGLMQCWRMNRDGSEQTQMTFSERNNWFPHVSPDGKRVVYLSYSRDGLDANEHLPNMQVQLRLMDYDGGNDRVLLEFFGGQGSINVNSWHPDSKQLAFVRYVLNHQ